MAEEDHQRLIGSGKKDRQQCSQGNDASGVEVRSHNRETALRHTAKKRARKRAESSGLCQSLIHLPRRAVLQYLQEVKCHEQKRQFFYTVEERVQKTVKNPHDIPNPLMLKITKAVRGCCP